jgi:hypothetical protein
MICDESPTSAVLMSFPLFDSMQKLWSLHKAKIAEFVFAIDTFTGHALRNIPNL